MRIIEITESKKEKMTEYVESALYAMGKVMTCLEELDSDMGERGRYGNRSMGNRYGNRDESGSMGNRDWDDEMDIMGERRRRRR